MKNASKTLGSAPYFQGMQETDNTKTIDTVIQNNVYPLDGVKSSFIDNIDTLNRSRINQEDNAKSMQQRTFKPLIIAPSVNQFFAENEPLKASGTSLTINTSDNEYTETVQTNQANVNNWPRIVEKALLWSPDIAEATAQLGVAREELGIATAGYFPQITADASTSYSPTSSVSQQSVNLRLSQMIYDFGKADAQVKSASGRINESEHEVAIAVEDVIRDTVSTLINAQAQKKAIQIRTEQLQEMQNLLELAQQRAQLGVSGQGDALEAQSNVESARSDLLDSKLSLSTALGELESLTGIQVEDIPSGKLPIQTQEACTYDEQATSNSPRILSAQARLEQAISQAEEDRSNLMPTLNLEPVVGLEPFSGGSLDDRISTNLSLSIDADLYQGGASQARVKASESGINSAQARIDAQRLEIERTLQEASLSLQSLTENQLSLRSRLDSLERVKGLYLRQYRELGSRTLTDLSGQYRSYFNALLSLNEAEQRIQQNGVTCMHAVGEMRSVFNTPSSRQSSGQDQ